MILELKHIYHFLYIKPQSVKWWWKWKRCYTCCRRRDRNLPTNCSLFLIEREAGLRNYWEGDSDLQLQVNSAWRQIISIVQLCTLRELPTSLDMLGHWHHVVLIFDIVHYKPHVWYRTRHPEASDTCKGALCVPVQRLPSVDVMTTNWCPLDHFLRDLVFPVFFLNVGSAGSEYTPPCTSSGCCWIRSAVPVRK